jgi:hypothetical protein
MLHIPTEQRPNATGISSSAGGRTTELVRRLAIAAQRGAGATTKTDIKRRQP